MGATIKINYGFGNLPYTIIAVCTSMIGYNIHNSIFWAVVDFIFFPIVWIKWLICHEVTLSIIKDTFSFFLK